MNSSRFNICFALSVGLLIAVSGASDSNESAEPAATFTAEQFEFFETEIRPLLVEHCQRCHGPDEHKGNLRLDSREAVLAGGDTGPAVVQGTVDAGELLKAVSYDPAGYQMPPDGQLPEESIALLRRWVEMGAPWPDNEATSVAQAEFDLASRAEHWSFQDLVHSAAPDVAHQEWCRSPLDRFILARLESAGLTPASEVNRDLWIRRVYFDVIGLPPSAGEVSDFLADESPEACSRVVDRLLASPRFGERWARHWLDLTRYTETRGHQYDYNIPNTWHYRDYVIRAFNADVPFDQFVIEHVAGDLLGTATSNQPLADAARPTGESQAIHWPHETFLTAATDDAGPAPASGDSTEVGGETATTTFTAEQLEFFETDVRPLLVENCQRCHGPDEQKGNLRLDSRSAVLQGGDTGPAIVPGQPDQSELVLAISYDPAGYQMPPDGKLPDDAIATLTRWVEMGAPWPDEQLEADAREEFDFEGRAQRWSFQPLQHVAVPEVRQPAWCRNPLDAFVMSQLEAVSLSPANEADRRTWLRRVYLDVIGVPPSLAATAAFLSDTSPAAYETVIDNLLASPQFGERWGRHWLDLARFADSRGHEFDADVPNSWHYRDYVIRAFNYDLPYDQFVVEHVAGDLLRSEREHALALLRDGRDLPPGYIVFTAADGTIQFASDQVESSRRPREYYARHREENGANESMLATGFWFFGEGVHSPVDIRQDEGERFADMIDVFSKTFLGMTVACARCHDHKFDPIRQADFYALQGYLQSTSYRQAMFETTDHNLAVARQLDEWQDRARPELLRTFAELSRPVVERLPAYLAAAREWIASAAVEADETFTPEQFSEAQREQLLQLALERELDGDLLTEWTAHLLRARNDVADPFHTVAQPDMISFMRQLREQLQAELTRKYERSANSEPVDDSPVVAVIYAASPYAFPNPSLAEGHTLGQDGVSFGTGEVAAGDLIMSDDPGAPISRIVTEPAIRRDPVWNDLSYTPGTIDDPGRLDTWERGGRTLRTASFDITSGKVFIYLRGGCRTYVEVDSHTINNGPLHGSLMAEHSLPENDPEGLRWRWVEHDVTRYQGHRAHLQVVLRGTEPLEIAAIVQSDRVPGSEPLSPPTPWWHSLHERTASFSEPVILNGAAAVLRFNLDILTDTNPPLMLTSQEPIRRYLLEWMRSHPELFGLNSDAARARFTEVATPLLAERAAIVADIRTQSATAPCMMEISPEDEYLFVRGNWKKPGDVIPRRFLEVFGGHGPADAADSSANHRDSGRLDLALQLVDPEQTPILPRVIVNRIWLHYFGRGLVPTPDDFGHLGELPSHPELLDWLANELVEHDWSLKHIHRIILLSSAYRMSSDAVDPAAEAADPNNLLLHRMNVKRMEAEIIRDAMLAISGSLNETMYGPPIPVYLTPFMEGRGRPGTSGPLDGDGRRSIYISVRRNFLDPMFQAFDFPLPHTTVGRRSISNVPAQALTLMNSPLVHELSQRWATRMLDETTGTGIDAKIAWLYESAFSRPATDAELSIGREFLQARAAESGAAVDSPILWAEFCHVLLNTKEFIFVR